MQPDAIEPRGRGIRTDGVRTVADLKARCVVDDITGCWHWRGGRTGEGHPSLWLPVLGKRVSLAMAICVLKTGASPKKGEVWHCTCETRCCANPAHRMAGTRSSQMLAAKLQRNPLQRARIAAGKRAVSDLSDEQCDEIRASTATLRELSERHRISLEHASNIRRGEARRPLGAVAPSSVFAWRPA